jgi:hypothetical protein
MGHVYGGGKLGARTQRKGHGSCLVDPYHAAVVEYEELAKLHDQLASGAP